MYFFHLGCVYFLPPPFSRHPVVRGVRTIWDALDYPLFKQDRIDFLCPPKSHCIAGLALPVRLVNQDQKRKQERVRNSFHQITNVIIQDHVTFTSAQKAESL